MSISSPIVIIVALIILLFVLFGFALSEAFVQAGIDVAHRLASAINILRSDLHQLCTRIEHLQCIVGSPVMAV